MALKNSIEEAAKRYPNPRSAIMPALFLAQKEHGFLSGDLLKEVAGILDVPEIWVYEVSTFYGMFHTEPVGKFHIKICTNLSCQLLEAESMLAHLEKKLAIETGAFLEGHCKRIAKPKDRDNSKVNLAAAEDTTKVHSTVNQPKVGEPSAAPKSGALPATG